MARKGMSGQLNMFDFFRSLEETPIGEVEMVSLVPEFEEEVEPVAEAEPEPIVEAEPVIEEEPKLEDKKPVIKESFQVAMSRVYERDGKKIEIAYINYNKVRITKGEETPVIKEFTSTKEAVDYYVEQMQEMESDE